MRSGQTGAQWVLQSLAALSKQRGTPDMRHRTLASAIKERQQTGEPVHLWPVVEVNETSDWSESYQTVVAIYVNPTCSRCGLMISSPRGQRHGLASRGTSRRRRSGRLVGLVSHRACCVCAARGGSGDEAEPVAVRSIMKPDPVTVAPRDDARSHRADAQL